MVVAVVLITVGLTVAPVAGVVGSAAETESDSDADSNETVSVSSFMQSSAADAESTVESGLFETEYESAANDTRADLVRDRTDDLEERLAALQAEREELRENATNLSSAEYNARITRLSVEVASLEQSVDRTIPRANETGLESDRLDELRANASELAGPEVATIARGVAGFDRQPGGPSTDGDDGVPGQSGIDTPPGQDSTPDDRETGDGNGTTQTADDGPTPNGTDDGTDRNETGADEDDRGTSNGPNTASSDTGAGSADETPGQ
ncbi:hypothetical protein [Natrarchaeobius halalkaliphilus]|nr:hypothetical protein [Natrarchaeobius halalkaliphilus]